LVLSEKKEKTNEVNLRIKTANRLQDRTQNKLDLEEVTIPGWNAESKARSKVLSPLKNLRTLVMSDGQSGNLLSPLMSTRLIERETVNEEKDEMIEKHIKIKKS